MCGCINLTEGMLLACVSVLSISRCDRNMLRSPFSMYSVTMHSGSDDTHTHSSRMMLGSFSRDMIFISFRKSFLMDRRMEEEERRRFHLRYFQLSVSDCLVFFTHVDKMLKSHSINEESVISAAVLCLLSLSLS